MIKFIFALNFILWYNRFTKLYIGVPELQKTAEIDSYHYGFISVFLFYVGGFMMFIMIDNYDSFVYNLSAYFQELGQDIKVIRNDKVTINELKK